MKRFAAILLSILMTATLSLPAFATASTQDSRGTIRGTIYWEKTYSNERLDESTSAYNLPEDTTTLVASYVENPDGSYTTYQYANGTLTEEHTTVPGSGVVEHVYYNADGTVTQSVENVALAQALARTSDGGYQVQGPPAQTTQRDMGYIHYRNSWTNTIYSVFVQTYDEYYPDSEFLFRQGLAKALAEWTSDILSMWAFATSGHKIVVEIISFLSATNVLDEGLNGIYTALVTKSIPCSYNNQRFYGNATAPSTDYPEDRKSVV